MDPVRELEGIAEREDMGRLDMRRAIDRWLARYGPFIEAACAWAEVYEKYFSGNLPVRHVTHDRLIAAYRAAKGEESHENGN